MLTLAVVIPTTGFLLQRLSTRTVFVLAMSLFSAAPCWLRSRPGSGCCCRPDRAGLGHRGDDPAADDHGARLVRSSGAAR
jgi:hypothetical protein